MSEIRSDAHFLDKPRADQQEHQPGEALRESEERFRMLADNISQLAWTCDLLGNVTWYNKRWLDSTGLTFEDMKGWDWKKVQHPDHVDRVVARVQRSGETGEPWEDTFPLRGRDGQYRWFLSRALPIRDEQGNLVQWFGTNTDVTEQKLAEEQVAQQAQELRALNDRLQALDRAKTAFFSNVSHEFRTPLTLMLGPLEDILSRANASLAPQDWVALQMAYRNGLRMQKLVNSLLDFSRIEAGRVQAVYEPTDLAALTADLASVFRSAIERAGMHLVVDCPPLAEPVYVDQDMWEKIVLNLLSNAFKFTF
jgi:PAS domain S-box-containing protein